MNTITKSKTTVAYLKAAAALHLAKDNANTSRSGYHTNTWALTTAQAEKTLETIERMITDKERELEALKDARMEYLIQVKLGGPEAYREEEIAQA